MSTHAPFDPTNTLGALEIGVLVSYCLFGVTSLQVYAYYAQPGFADDPRALKLLIGSVWLLELAHGICIGQVLYAYTIQYYGQPQRLLGMVPTGLALSVVVSGFITAIVQSFFAYRIFSLSAASARQRPLFRVLQGVALALWLSEAVYVVLSLAGTVLTFTVPSIQAFLERYRWLLFAPWVMNLVQDTTITASLVLLLLQTRSKGLDSTTAMVDQLVTWTIETGLITSLFSILNLVIYDRFRGTFIWVAIQVVKTRLFANSLMASLNSRAKLRALEVAAVDGNGLDTSANIAMTSVTFASDEDDDGLPGPGLPDRRRSRDPAGDRSLLDIDGEAPRPSHDNGGGPSVQTATPTNCILDGLVESYTRVEVFNFNRSTPGVNRA
ncbi:hypothetical protein MIND_01341600 [Mycena indigotica]|uniref:DUF6534 domain-containing protein n=1 Tax=Mycena indigotica TaxID=2126181 RepID=A0A8H6S0D3_9AGAR|nr:uncharacterized protein MIND_01341600 [Mycena indigotica]KAF7290278.1 hypothetical protein MIND_01341600 [Mycena indigotica]